jgi:hypothetical protein
MHLISLHVPEIYLHLLVEVESFASEESALDRSGQAEFPWQLIRHFLG